MEIGTITALTKLLFDGLAILVILFLYVKNDKKRQQDYEDDRKEYKKRSEEEIQRYDKIIGDIIKGSYKHHLTPQEGHDIAQIEKQINDIINIILKETNASRVCIIKYHNGNKDMTGKSFLKMSMTNEVVNIGVAPMMAEFKDVFRSLLAYWCHEMEIHDYCYIKDVEDIKSKDMTMYQYLSTRNIEAKYGISLKDLSGNVIGFMCIEYLNKNDFNLENIYKSIKKNFPKIEALTTIEIGGK